MFLFAALSYAFTSNEKGQVKDISDERARLIAGQILQTANLLENTLLRIRTTGACSDIQVSFENQVSSGYANANAPSDKHCHAFDPAGGGMIWPDLSKNSTSLPSDWLFTGRNVVRLTGTGDLSIADPTTFELTAIITDVTDKICAEINRQSYGIAEIPANASSSAVSLTKFTGAYGGAGARYLGGSSHFGRRFGCVQFTAQAYKNVFFYVLIAR